MEWGSAGIYIGLVIAMAVGMLVASRLLGPRRPRPAKDAAYDCGVEPIGSPRERFSVHFYLVAILFILFDIETVFLIPWAVLYRKLGVPGLVEVGIFVAVLGFGLLYVLKRRALEWE
ncbi:MAG: NADH-quinone oxidoreductase subunit A [Planctomycetes bacterium]|nr:NADH-quinone oxidoreductase subunit A [Planctomycetota bacterium]